MNKQDFIIIMQRTQKPLTNMVEMIPEDKLDWAPDEG
ncbi:MAG: DinB family protein, partial [bacterium]|nr:DinB family protein [bacterium]